MYWILKTEPSAYSFENLERDKTTRWDGVRNYQARNNLRTMELDDLCFIYESVGPKQIIGTATVIRTAYPDPADTAWSCVDIQLEKRIRHPITLEVLKNHPALKEIALVKQSRLSVSPLSLSDYEALEQIANPAHL